MTKAAPIAIIRFREVLEVLAACFILNPIELLWVKSGGDNQAMNL